MRNSEESCGSTNTSGLKTVQFGNMIASFEISDEVSEFSGSEENEPSDKNFSSWNERMRHQQVVQFKSYAHLENLTTKLFLVILERCLESIVILREMYGMSYIDINLEYVPSNEKYENMEYDLQTPVKSELPNLAFKKLRRDISWIEKILLLTIANLRKSWNYESLLKILNDDRLMREEEYILLTAKKFNQTELHKLRLFEEAERDELVRNIQTITEELGNLKDELNDNITEYDVKIRYLKKWENARYEQNEVVLKSKEHSLFDVIRKTGIQIDRENRVHEEINKFLDETLKDYQQGIENWMDKYDAETDEWETSINKLKIDVEVQREDYINLMEKYEQRKEIMENYKKEKLRKQQEAEELQKRTQAATRIQSWWRGVMFRKGLGPWRRKKGKGKKGSSPKNSGKNKKQ
ncbi:IQ domain-containing protein G-like [Asbolus verrucosus]|uniref:Dynein regulatory complex protein 9 n=1 Tax=Asbolus verrucosus TaxID=1661398 RepID=A0A482VYZ0_ASBVE|nr:IQ domain-containing protein G-like [Asbolus verrucosus]